MDMYQEFQFNFRIYADRKSELDFKYNHEVCWIQDDYLNHHPELKREVRWVYVNKPMNNYI
jgi:hypothetical protein